MKFEMWLQADLGNLKVAMTQEVPPVEQACLFPRFEQIALFIHQHPQHSLPSTLQVFADRSFSGPRNSSISDLLYIGTLTI